MNIPLRSLNLPLMALLLLCAAPVKAEDAPRADLLAEGELGPEQPRTAPKNQLKKLELSDTPYVMPNHGYTVSFVHKENTAPHEAVLRVSFPLSLSGCFRAMPPEAETKILGSRLQITMGEPVIKLDDSRQYANNACERNTGANLAVDAVLDRDELIKKKINKIIIKNALGQETFDMQVTESQISLFTKIRDPVTNSDRRVDWHGDKFLFKPYEGSATKTPLTYWFYPENTVVLSVPMARADLDLSEEIRSFARSRGMIPIESVLPDFENPSTIKSKLYFVDQVGSLAQTLGQSSSIIGTITIPEIFYGPDGPYERPREVEIAANIPGLME